MSASIATRATLLLLSYLTVANSGSLPPLKIHPDVQSALDRGDAVVALESTIISHGMPYPQNEETARRVEEAIKSRGATPATIAILDGVCCIGLDDAELERFAQLGSDGAVAKVSRRDLALCVANKGHGGTTVSCTMLLAHAAGITTFVTGGIGGVHRGGEDTMDVSADLNELGRTPVMVVSAGAKSILDIPRTLEYLETQGVPVVSLSCDEFPAFFTRSSGSKSPAVVGSCAEAAALAHAQYDIIGLQSGMLVGVPIPEDEEAEAAHIQGAIDQALKECNEQGIYGNKATPFLLKRVNELTEGQSLKANIALVINNAINGADIAIELAKLRKAAGSASGGGGGEGGQAEEGFGAAPKKFHFYFGGEPIGRRGMEIRKQEEEDRKRQASELRGGSDGGGDEKDEKGSPIVVGGAVADLVAFPHEGTPLLPRTSNPGETRRQRVESLATLPKRWAGLARRLCSSLRLVRMGWAR